MTTNKTPKTPLPITKTEAAPAKKQRVRMLTTQPRLKSGKVDVAGVKKLNATLSVPQMFAGAGKLPSTDPRGRNRPVGPWGKRLGTRANIVDAVLLAAKGPLSVAEIEAACAAHPLGKQYLAAHGVEPGGIYGCLRQQQRRGFVELTNAGWVATAAGRAVNRATS